MVICDIDGDGALEIIIGWGMGGVALGGLHSIASDGTVEWSHNEVDLDPLRRGVCVCDVDLDGKIEVLYGFADDKCYCLDSGG